MTEDGNAGMLSALGTAERLDAELTSYVRLRDEHEYMEKRAKDAKKRMEDQRDRVWDMLEAAGVKTINHELGRITRTARLQAIVTDDDRLRDWCRQEGVYDAMTKVEFRKANLNSLAAELMEDGREMPEGLDTITIRSITLTRKK